MQHAFMARGRSVRQALRNLTPHGHSIKEAAAERARRQKERQRSEKAASTSGKGPAPAKQAADIGTFERHTKGIGAKLMASMGYKPGEGLGRNRHARLGAPLAAPCTLQWAVGCTLFVVLQLPLAPQQPAQK